ncbi:MAG: VCBS repeat-containing protein [Roseibacillus sp.]
MSKRLKSLLRAGDRQVLADEFASTELRPSLLIEKKYHGGLRALRPRDPLGEVTRYEGWAGFAAARGILLGEDPARLLKSLSIKVIDLKELESEFSAEVLVELGVAGLANDSLRQINATWLTRWTKESPPRLSSLQVEHYEECWLGPGQRFVDISAAVLGGTEHYPDQVLRGTGDWATRLTRLGDFSLTGHHGLAVGDVNGDGLEDLYVCDGGSLPNRLYLQQKDGTVVDGSAEAGVDWLEDSRSALLIDLDNDGDEDLVVATIAMVIFLENDGTGNFSLRGGHPGAPYPFSLSAADYDNDGLLDIHVCVYSAGDDAERRGFEVNAPRPFHDAGNGGRNILLKNLGDFGFADATAAVGLDTANSRWSFAAAWEDYDRDGDPDLYVANDFGRNCLYQNEGGRFRQIADKLKIEDMASGMSVAWGDYNRDGCSDIYVGNMFSAAGNRISRQKLFTLGSDPDLVGKLRRMARGNSLFAGGQGERGYGFRDVSEGSRSYLGQWAWSAGFGDLNNDGWEDLVISNGFLTGREPDDL